MAVTKGLTLNWQVPRTTGHRPLLSVNQARSFLRECQVACACRQGAGKSPKYSRGSRTREQPQGSAGGFSSAATAPLRGRPQAAPAAAHPQPATSSSFPSRRARATTCQREPARRPAFSCPPTTRSTPTDKPRGRSAARSKRNACCRSCGVSVAWGITTSRSRSESGRASPRAREPNSSTRPGLG